MLKTAIKSQILISDVEEWNNIFLVIPEYGPVYASTEVKLVELPQTLDSMNGVRLAEPTTKLPVDICILWISAIGGTNTAQGISYIAASEVHLKVQFPPTNFLLVVGKCFGRACKNSNPNLFGNLALIPDRQAKKQPKAYFELNCSC